MENTVMMKQFRTIGKVQSVISKAETLDEALQGGLKEILNGIGIENAVIWYQDKKGDGKLHPFFWIAPIDFTKEVHIPGEEIVGKVFESQTSVRLLDYKQNRDARVDSDFEGIDIESMICVPLSDEHEDLGCIQFVNTPNKGKITDEEADVCEILTMLASIAIYENENIVDMSWQTREPIMSARDVTKEFQNGDIVTQVLKGVNLDIYQGEFLVILGESGCGKSTFMNILGGMDKATGGTFSYMGEEMSGFTQDQLTKFRRDNIGFIFQSYNLMPNLTAKQNLDLIGELVSDPMDSLEALKLVGLESRSMNYPSQLSGGQQQRVSIARALVKKPKLIFADEPTAALDYTTSIEVLEVLENVLKTGTTLVMVTHNEEITRMANRVVRMRNGRTYEVTVNKHPVPAKELVW